MRVIRSAVILILFSSSFAATSHARSALYDSGPVDCAEEFVDQLDAIEEAYSIAYDRCSGIRIPEARQVCWNEVSIVLWEMMNLALEELRRCNGLPSEPEKGASEDF